MRTRPAPFLVAAAIATTFAAASLSAEGGDRLAAQAGLPLMSIGVLNPGAQAAEPQADPRPPAEEAPPPLPAPGGSVPGAVPKPWELAGPASPFSLGQVVAFYGKPDSKRMGILGEYPKEDLARLLRGYARLYDEANGEQSAIPAFYIIYGTCWPGGEIGYLRESIVREYVEYALEQGILVVLDHQIGKHGVSESLARLLPFLRYPNVNLALDPEWRTTNPMKEIGSVSAEELNAAQALMSDYLAREGLPGTRLLVVHQFVAKMIAGRERVRTDYPGVELVHTADGFGAPAIKRVMYNYNAKAENMPNKGFKLFFKSVHPGAGFDEPLLTPPEVNALQPRPLLVIYQ